MRTWSRSVPAVAKIILPICDVRNVAESHLKALVVPEAQNHRHLIVTQSLWMKQVALILQKEFKQYGYSIPTMSAPNVFVWLNSLMDREYKAVVPRLSREYYYANARVSDRQKALSVGSIVTIHHLFRPPSKRAPDAGSAWSDSDRCGADDCGLGACPD
jgi:hypothetical protein